LTPHMCNVCWVNDHMYCRNMKRIARELPNFSGCIHYIACEHYRQSGVPTASSQESRSSESAPWLRWTNRRTDNKPTMSHRVMSADDLLCNENMMDSGSELSNDGVEAAKLLHIQLQARTNQIFRSLGVSKLPKSVSPPPAATAVAPDSTVTAEDDNVLLEPEEYAAEIVINSDGEHVQEWTEMHQSLEATAGSLVAGSQGDAVMKDEVHWGGDCDNDRGRYYQSSSSCSLASFDGTSHEPHGTSHKPPSANVTVHVRPVSDNRILIKYPNYRTSPTEYTHLDVTFPNGATEEVVNSYVKNDVARFIRKTKSGTASDVPVSVTVVKDQDPLRTTDKGDSLPDVRSTVESRHGRLQFPVSTVCNKSVAAESVDETEIYMV